VGRYTVLRELARGGMGVVYLAWDPHLRVQRAVKLLLGEPQTSQEAVERFLREARLLARLQHPNIITVLEAGFDGPYPYLVLPFVEGGSLEQRLRQRGRLDPREAAELLDRVARAIDFAHGEKVVHRDLKPANVLLDAAGTPLVTDFGIASDLQARDALTRTGQLLGTPAYMPPEQAAGERERVGPRSDVYSLGAILYELLSGVPPFVGTTPLNVVKAILTDPPRPLAAAAPDAPRDLAAVVSQAMAKAPADRYDSAAALAADLRRFLEGRPVSARSLSLVARAGRALARRPLLAGAVAGVVLLGAGGGASIVAARRAAARFAAAADLTGQAALARARGDLAVARDLLTQARGLAPEAAGATAALAWLELEQGRLDEAQRLAGALPASAGALDLAGALAAARGDDVAAVAAYTEALRLEPANDGLRTRAAAALLRQGEHAAAEAALGEASGPGADRARAQCFAARGAVASAEAAWWRVLRAEPDDAAALAGLVDLRLAQADVDGLSRLWEEVHRRLGGPYDPSLQQLTSGDLPALVADLRAGAPAARLRAALGLAASSRPDPVEALRAVADAPGTLGEAARAGLLAGDRVTFADWVQIAHTLEEPHDAAAAATLLERAHRLGPGDGPALDRLVRARGVRLRRALALALAVAATRRGEDPAWAIERLRALGAGDTPAVQALAATAERACAAFQGEVDAPPDALRLALALATLREAPAAGAAAALELLLAAPAVERSADLLAARAQAALEANQRGAARADVVRALDLARGHPGALALDHLLGSPGALAALRSVDPAAADEAERRAGLAHDLDAWVLPGPAGADRLVWFPDRARTDERPGPFEGQAWREEVGEDGYTFHDEVLLRARFAMDPVHGVEVHARQEHRGAPALRLLVRLHSSGVDQDGRLFRVTDAAMGQGCEHQVDRTFVAQRPSVAPLQRAVRVVVRRGAASTLLQGASPEPDWAPVLDGPLGLRRVRGEPEVVLGLFAQRSQLQRVLVEGVALGRSYRPPPRGAPPARQPAPSSLPVLGESAPAPADLGALRRDGAALQVEGERRWVSNVFDAPRVVVPRLRGDVLVRAQVTLDPIQPYVSAGVALRRHGGHDRVYVALGDPIPGSGAPAAIYVLTQRGFEWETYAAMAPWDGPSAALLLERRGDWVLVGWDQPGVADVAPRLHLRFPLEDPVDVLLVGRNYERRPPVTARFERLEVLEPVPAGLAPRR
jgi:hypothetical protein